MVDGDRDVNEPCVWAHENQQAVKKDARMTSVTAECPRATTHTTVRRIGCFGGSLYE